MAGSARDLAWAEVVQLKRELTAVVEERVAEVELNKVVEPLFRRVVVRRPM